MSPAEWMAGAALLSSVLAACCPAVPSTSPAKHNPMDEPAAARVAIADASASPITFDRIAAFPQPGWQIPRQAQLSPDGKLVTYLQSESASEDMALYAFDIAKREAAVLLRASDLVATEKPMSREEELRRERQRKRIKGVTSHCWAEDANVMLLPVGGDVFVRSATGEIKQLTDSPESAIDPKLCADGSKVAFARGRELFVVEVASGKERQLTAGAPQGTTRGQSDFNGQEEFGEPSGLWWSPRCDRLAYLEVDVSKVARIPIMGYRDTADLQHHRYPRAGGTNPAVRLGVVELASGKTTWLQLPTTKQWDPVDQYLGRVEWSHDGQTLFVQQLSRSQRHLALARADLTSGQVTQLLQESDDSWLHFSDMRALQGGDILWTALRDGHRHIERRSAGTGELLATLTSGQWDVSRIAGVDEKRGVVLFIANKDSLLDRQLYARPLDGSGAIEQLTPEDGVHQVTARRPEHGLVDIHSANDRPPKAVIRDPRGKTIGQLPVATDDDIQALSLRPVELVTLSAPRQHDLRGALLTPRDMKPGARYPAIVMVYGGPGVQTVLNAWNPRLMWQHLADRGFVIWQLDNRGSTGRGHAFETTINRRLGEIELDDQLRGLDHLTSLSFVDASRIGIYGHSYGGYMAVLAMLRAPGRFKAAAAGSPVTDWRLYDTGYTERYMGTPADNAPGYAASELIPHVAKLDGKLLVIHSLMDENVHFEHTAKLIDALVAEDKDFELMVFPGERHGYRSAKARRYAYRRVVDFFAENL